MLQAKCDHGLVISFLENTVHEEKNEQGTPTNFIYSNLVSCHQQQIQKHFIFVAMFKSQQEEMFKI